jgi:hypothetical protein
MAPLAPLHISWVSGKPGRVKMRIRRRQPGEGPGRGPRRGTGTARALSSALGSSLPATGPAERAGISEYGGRLAPSPRTVTECTVGRCARWIAGRDGMCKTEAPSGGMNPFRTDAACHWPWPHGGARLRMQGSGPCRDLQPVGAVHGGEEVRLALLLPSNVFLNVPGRAHMAAAVNTDHPPAC